MVYLSPHFTLDELTISETAERLGLSNQPGPSELAVLKRTALGLRLCAGTTRAPGGSSNAKAHRSPGHGCGRVP